MKEPERKSFLDVLKRIYSVSDRPILTTRFAYVGEYKGSDNDLRKKMKQNVEELNAEYGEIVITGVLFIYPKLFVHLIEASEVTIYRHLKIVFSKGSDMMLGHAILLPPYHNVHRTYFTHWYCTYIANPPCLLDKIVKMELSEIQKQVRNCLSKIYLLCEHLLQEGHRSHEKTNEVLKKINKDVPHYLPEITVINYLLSVKLPVVTDVRYYLTNFCKIPYINFYNDHIWPPPGSFAPRYL